MELYHLLHKVSNLIGCSSEKANKEKVEVYTRKRVTLKPLSIYVEKLMMTGWLPFPSRKI